MPVPEVLLLVSPLVGLAGLALAFRARRSEGATATTAALRLCVTAVVLTAAAVVVVMAAAA